MSLSSMTSPLVLKPARQEGRLDSYLGRHRLDVTPSELGYEVHDLGGVSFEVPGVIGLATRTVTLVLR